MQKKNNVLANQISVAQFAVFFELIPVAIAVTTVDEGRFVYVNNNFEQLMLGHRDDILGKTSTDLQILTMANRNQFVKNFDKKNNHKNQKFSLNNFAGKKLNIIRSVEKIDIDNTSYFITTLTDVSAKLLANKEIRDLNNKVANQQKEKLTNNSRLKTANFELENSKKEKNQLGEDLQHANTELQNNDNEKNMREDEYIIKNNLHQEAQTLGQIGSWDWNLKTDEIYWTDEMYRIYGLPIQKQKIDVSNSLMSIHPEDIEKVQYETDQSINLRRPFHCFYRIIRPDKSIRYINAVGKIYVNTQDQITRLAGVAHDITDKQQAQKLAYSRILIEASCDPLFTITKNGKISDVNKAAIEILKSSELDLLNSNFSDYFVETDLVKKLNTTVFKTGVIIDFPLTLKNQQQTEVLFNGSVFTNDANTVVGAVVVARDITALKMLTKELTEAKTAAENAAAAAIISEHNAHDATRSKQQFLSNMSHEIRTPMNAIIGFTKVVLKTNLTAKQKEYLTAIKMSGDSLIVLINDILDLAKVDSGKMSFEQVPFKLQLSISAMLHLFETKIQEKNLTLEIDYDNRIPEILEGDPTRLHQIILNLVSNAVKFTNAGKIIVKTALVEESSTTVSVKFSIQDTGIGIKANVKNKIFDNFQQATDTTSRLYGGTGLGLAIAKQLVEAQGGKISVSSKINHGSTFSFVMDFQKSKTENVHEPEILELDSNIKNTKILVVEDVELNQLLMKTLLDDFGFECDISANGKLAIEKLKTKQYDIILMDLQMPEMDGFAATDYIRKKLKLSIPIIALTADVTTADVEKCKAVGMNDYISKPVDERLLYSKLISFSKKPIVIIEHTKGDNHQNDTVKYVDMSYLKKLTKSEPKLMSQMITSYLEQTPPLILSMKKSLESKDWKLLQSSVHKMIPSFSIMGINPKIELMAKKIQEYAFTIEITKEIHDIVYELEKVCSQACLELEVELKNLNIT